MNEENLEEKVKELEAKVSELQSKAEEYLDQWRRTAADFANYRKRVEKEQAEQTKYANAALIAKLLPILDDFERAFQTIPPALSKLTWLDGIFLIHRKFQYILEQEGLKPIETQGQFFDPYYHEAISYEETDHYEDGQIIGEIQKGYMLHDKVLRPALVKVAKKKLPPEPQPQQEQQEKRVEEGSYAGEDTGN
jgi:molecular chaperone GrpE